MSEIWWVIEMQGPAYLGARQLGGYEFYWTEDVGDAIQFRDRHQANLTMMAVRQLRGDLFPSCLTRVPCAVEHATIQARSDGAERKHSRDESYRCGDER